MIESPPLVTCEFKLSTGADVDGSYTIGGPLALYVRFGCGCGTRTGWADVRGDSGAAIRRHLAEQHAAAVGFGVCAKCGSITDYFHAVVPDLVAEPGAVSDVWACEQHGPKRPALKIEQGSA